MGCTGGVKGLDLAHGLGEDGSADSSRVRAVSNRIAILSWETMSVKSLWIKTRPGSHLSLGFPSRTDPEARMWVQEVSLGFGPR